MNEKVEMGIVRGVSLLCAVRDLSLTEQDRAKRVVVITMGVIGDMILMVPFFRNLRYNYPEAEITVVCKGCVLNLLEKYPYIDKLVVFDRIMDGKHKFERNIKLIHEIVREYFGNQVYDAVFVPGYLALSLEMLMSKLIRSRRRYLFTGDIYKDDGVLVTDTSVRRTHWLTHVVDRELFLLKASGAVIKDDYLETWTTEEDKRKADVLMKRAELKSGKLIMLVFLGTSAPFKDWPLEKYIDACKILLEQHEELEIILLGDKKNTEHLGMEFCREITNAHNFIGMTSLRESIEMTRRADIFLGGDTGTLHMAVATQLYGVVVVKDYAGACDVYGSPMVNFSPWQSPIHVVRPDAPLQGCEIQCNELEAHCITQISVETVVNAMNMAIAERKIHGKRLYRGT